MTLAAILNLTLAFLLAPLLAGVIARVKARVAGRRGQPLLQGYCDLLRLLRKGVVYSDTTTWIFRACPIVVLATAVTAVFLLPMGGEPAPVSFAADFVLLAYLLGLGRFFLISAALDTGSSFEGMGASRETFFATLAEPTFLLGVAALARKTGGLSLSTVLPAASPLAPEVGLIVLAFSIVLLCENARIPFDDPTTHLELTMVHEVMILDHSGPDLGLLLYASHLKLWLWSALVAGLATSPLVAPIWLRPVIAVAGTLVVAVGVGLVEALIPRLRLMRVPHLLATAAALAAVALILVVR
jgi:formate hydrogenlyase subunit 4